jgi:hypothetical protein
MSADPYDFELVILGTESQGFPHLEVIQSANPGLIIHTEILPDPDDAAARQTAWRNCDRNLTNWWIDNRESVSKSRVLFLEWDTFANVDLRTIVPGDFRRSPSPSTVSVTMSSKLCFLYSPPDST